MTVVIVRAYKPTYVSMGAKYMTSDINTHLFGGYCLSFFSTMNQFGVVNVLSEMNKQTETRIYKLIVASVFIPLVCYLVISVAGYSICGDKCPNVVINMAAPPGYSNPIIEYSKLLFVLCLMVGIILRNQISHTSVIDILKSYRQSDETLIPKELREIEMEDFRESGQRLLGDQQTSPSSKKEESSQVEFYLSGVLNSFLPVAFALGIQQNVFKHIQTGYGFFAPIIIIVFPCRMTLKLHSSNRIQLSGRALTATYYYMYIMTFISYLCLVANLIKNYF